MGELNFRPLDNSRFESTAELFNEVFSKSAEASDFAWKYREELFGRLYGIQAEDEDRQVMAHVAAVPLEGIFAGEKMPFFQFVDAMVHPSWRGRNTLTAMIHSLLAFIRAHHPVFFPYVFPGPVSSKIGEKHGWLKRLRSVEDVVVNRPERIRPAEKLQFISFDAVDPLSFISVADAIWEKLSRLYPILIKRDGNFLRWRYVSHPWFSYDFYVVKRLWKPVGWIVVESRHNNPVRIVDYLVPPFVMEAVIRRFLHELNLDKAIVWIPDVLRLSGVTTGEAHPTPIDISLVTDGLSPYIPSAETVRHCFFYTMGDIDIY